MRSQQRREPEVVHRGAAGRVRSACLVLVTLVVAVVLGGGAVVGAQDDPAPDDAVEEPAGAPDAPPADEPLPAGPAPDTGGLEAPSTTLSIVTPPAGDDSAEVPLTDSERARQRLDLIVVALVALAAIVAVGTAVFWRWTKPSRVAARASAGVPRAPGDLEQLDEPTTGWSIVTTGAVPTVRSGAAGGSGPATWWGDQPEGSLPGVASTGSGSQASSVASAAGTGSGLWASQGWGTDATPPAASPPAPPSQLPPLSTASPQPEAQDPQPEAQDAPPEAQDAPPEAQDPQPVAQDPQPVAQDPQPEAQEAPPEATRGGSQPPRDGSAGDAMADAEDVPRVVRPARRSRVLDG